MKKMKNFKLKMVGLSVLLLIFNSCVNDLETKPLVDLSLENLLAQDPNAVQGLISKMYGSLSLSGGSGPTSSDITGPDAGETVFLRGIINLQDFTADGMKNRWGDDGLDQLTTTSGWTANNKFFKYLYDRVYYTVPNCNNIIRAIKTTNIDKKDEYISELRFIRALAYFYMIDCFGKGVIVTEDDLGSTVPKPQASRAEMFAYVESELLAIESLIPAANSYGRANKAVVRMLLSKLYLNAQVYTGTARYNDAASYIKKVIDEGGYSIAPDFDSLFLADNNTTSAKNEMIFPLIADENNTQSYGNATYLVNGNMDKSTMLPSDFGVSGDGWGGHRATKALYGLYGATEAALLSSTDKRSKSFWTSQHSYEMTNYKTWKDGYPYLKFKNKKFIGTGINTVFSSADFPLFRLADAYLIYAECAVRNASNADKPTALQYVNEIRTRANAPTISLVAMTEQFILDERARELTMEGHRRTDLIRFNKFTGGSYLWPWKGGTFDGISIPTSYNLFPIPLTAIQSNPNLTQNPGY